MDGSGSCPSYFVMEDLAQIAAVNHLSACGTFDEMIGFVLWISGYGSDKCLPIAPG